MITMAARPASPARPATPIVPGYTVTLALRPESVPLARLSARNTVMNWGLGNLADDAVLIVSELVTNCIEHAAPNTLPGQEPGRCRLALESPAARTVRVSVSDASPRRPRVRVSGVADEHGRGLAIVGALAADWGTEPTARGKTVWALLKAAP